MLILIAVRQRRQRGQPRKPPAWMARLDRLSLLGRGRAGRVPAALDAGGGRRRHHPQAKLTTPGSYLALMFFCLLATSSFLYLELYATFAPAPADARLRQLRTWLDTHQDQVIIVVFLLLGFWLAGKSIYLLVS